MKLKQLLCIILCVCLSPMTLYAARNQGQTLSPAIAVISRSFSLIKTGSARAELNFTAEDFESLLGFGELKAVSITSLPDESAGTLMLGELEVMENQTVSRANLSALRFLPKSNGNTACSFDFSAGEYENHSLTCKIYLIDGVNTAPTSNNSEITTFKNIAIFGELSAYDLEGDSLTFEITEYPDRGLLTMLGGGEYKYTPVKNYLGHDSFKYVARDSYGNVSEEIKTEINIRRSDDGAVFTDLIGRREHYGAICLHDAEILEGRRLGEKMLFDADAPISGAEFLTAVMKVFGIEPQNSGEGISVGSDLLIPSVCRPYVAVARGMGIITGDAFTDLVNSASRAEAFSAVAALLGLTEMPSSTPELQDSSEIPKWAEIAVYALLEQELISAESGSIYPERELTRAEAAELLSSILLMQGK